MVTVTKNVVVNISCYNPYMNIASYCEDIYPPVDTPAIPKEIPELLSTDCSRCDDIEKFMENYIKEKKFNIIDRSLGEIVANSYFPVK